MSASNPRRITGTAAAEFINVPLHLGSLPGGATVDAAAGDDGVYGGVGADSLIGGLGQDTLWGNDGHDSLNGGSGHDILYAGLGDDSLTGGEGNDSAWGGLGHDRISLGDGADLAYGEDGNDTIAGGAGSNSLWGGAGDDLLTGGDDADQLFGEAGNDTLRAAGGANRAQGGEGDDVISAGSGNDTLGGDGGNDTIAAGAGNNQVWAGSGDDTVTGGAGNDSISADAGNDAVDAGAGDNTVHGGAGNDTLVTGSGSDSVTGDEGDDRIAAGGGNDTVHAGGGADSLVGGAGNDLITGDAGRDTIEAGAGADTVYAGDGDDLMIHARAGTRPGELADGGAGFDTLRLDFTLGEWLNSAVQAEIARYVAFLAAGQAGWASFAFSFGLTARAIEAAFGRVGILDLTLADDPVTAVDDAATLSEDGTASGNILANDTVPDLVKAIAIVTGQSQGILTLEPDGDFHYDPGSAYQWLAAGETAVETFTYRVTDADGDTDQATVTLTVTGANDGPSLSVGTGDSAAAALTEGDGTLDAAGTISLVDVDLSDVVGVSVKTVAVTAGAGLLPAGLTKAKLLGFLSATSGDTAATAGGKVAWTFDSDGQAFNFLRDGQVLTLVYTLEANDGKGGKAAQAIAITITGTNDAPRLAAIAAPAAIAELADASAQDIAPLSGVLEVTDRDRGDTLTAEIRGTTVTLASGGQVPAGLAEALAAGTLDFGTATSDGGKTTIGWSWDPPAVALDFLPQGETLKVTYRIAVGDGLDPSNERSLTFTISGTNDAPVVTGPVTGTATEDGAAVTLDALANASDLDAGTVLAVVGVPQVLPAGVSYDAASGRFTLDPGAAAYQDLAAGETRVVSVDYGVSDGIATTPASVSWTVTGTNDGPVLSVGQGNSASATLTEANTKRTAAGSLTLVDLDVTDVVGVSVKGVAVAQGAGLLPTSLTNAKLLGFMSASSSDTALTAGGTVSWTFDSTGEAFNFLRAGQVLGLVYTLEANDGRGGTTTRDVTITIDGTNDAPGLGVIASPAAISELADASAQDIAPLTGTLQVNDRDIGDTLTPAIQSVAVALSSGGAVPSEVVAALADGALSFGTLLSNGATRQLGWRWDPAPAALDFLSAGEKLTVTYGVAVGDGTATSETRSLVFTINGTNDAPVIGAAPPGVLGFDDIALGDGAEQPMPGYGGFTWSQAGTYDPRAGDGLGYVTTSGDQLAFFAEATGEYPPDPAAYPQPAGSPMVIRRADGADFSFLGARFSAAQVDNLTVTATAFDDGMEVGEVSFAISRGVATAVSFQGIAGERFSSIDELRFDAESFFGFDDFTFADLEPRVTERADGAMGENDGVLTTSGSLSFTDADLLDLHSVSVAAVGGATLGALVASVAMDTTGVGAGGRIDWSYSVGAGLLDPLAAGETRIESFTVTLADGKGGTSARQVDVTLVGVNDAPQFTEADRVYDFGAVNEDLPAGVVVGQVFAVDADTTDALTYAITSGNGAGLFTIDPASGLIRTTASLDYETASVHSLGVSVADRSTGGLVDTAVVQVGVGDMSLERNTRAFGSISSAAVAETSDPGLVDYWTFSAAAGQTVTLDGDRAEGGYDMGFWIFSGARTQADFGSSIDPSDPGFLFIADDSTAPAIAGPFGDPYVTFQAPVTGTYTVVVVDVASGSDGGDGQFSYSLLLS